MQEFWFLLVHILQLVYYQVIKTKTEHLIEK